ncbi:hypothetical protein Bbelb_350690 [Branchiostoma belcheri]|nr:hypothetical protein Bbelb_350690 [Branchiostoma belcheri]
MLKQSEVFTLALIDAKIAEVKDETFAGFSRLNKLSLCSNRLTNVKQTWFKGLENLILLILSNNNIKQIEPESFANLTRLFTLELENNLLQVVDPSWLCGLKGMKELNLRSNAIFGISQGSFEQMQLSGLDMRDNDLSCLDGEVLRGQSWLTRLHVSSGRLSSVHDAMPHEMMWSLHRLTNVMRGSVTMLVEVPKFLFCARHNAHELSLGWKFDSSDNVAGNTEFGSVNPGRSCGPSVVVLATDASLADRLNTSMFEQCRQVWEYDGGITVVLVGNLFFRLVSMASDSTDSEVVAMSFFQDTGTLTTAEPGSSLTHTTHTTIHNNTKNISCILLTRDEHMKLFFTVPSVHHQTHTTETTYRTVTDHSSSPTHYFESTEKGYTSSGPEDQSSLQLSTTSAPDLEVVQAPDHVLISVVVSAVVLLVMLSLAVLIWKVCVARLKVENDRASDDAHIWTIPPGVTFPGLLRSASLPACSGKMASDDAVSCRSLPAVLHSIEPTYSVIPDDVAAVQRPLPGLPHVYWEIPDDVSDVVRPASLPACTRGGAPDDTASCRSLPAVLQSIEPTYSQIPDHIAAAQRPLPALPRSFWEIPDHERPTQRPLPALPHTYSEIPDDGDSGPMSFYADGEISLHVVTNRRQNRRSGRSVATYGSRRQSSRKVKRNPFYRKATDVACIRARRQLRTAPVTQLGDQGVRTYVNVTDAILSGGHDVTRAHIAFLTLPDIYRSGEVQGLGNHITPRRASLPTVTLPNTYWPWEIPGEGTSFTRRRVSLPTVTLPNTYWPWGIPGEGTPNTPRHASLPTVTLPNTYWPWEIPGEGTSFTRRRVSLPTVTLPNTYWPWEISGEGTPNTPRRVSLPTVTLPNTYWPWEIPGEGTRNTPRCASLPTVTLPNTYWPWEISGEGTPNTPRCASLPTVTLPNTYWPWEISGEGTPNTPRCASLPTVTLPNTYWPWEIPGEGTRNTPRRAPLPTVTLPNTYWPWEISGEGTRNTPRRASLPTVTLPNTYWPWEISGEGTCNTPRRAPLPTVTLPNTYWPWEIPGEGTPNTPRRAPLHTVTLPNTYWPWEIPGERTRNTPRREGTPNTPQRSALPTVTLPNTYWPWEIPGEGTPNTPQRSALPTVTLPNTYWPWEIPGEGTP